MLRTCLSIIGTVFILGCSNNVSAEQKIESKELLELSQRLRYLENFGFSGVVTIKEKERVLLQEAYGYSDVESREANKPETKFPLLSMTKPMLAAGVLLLEEQGVLDLNKPINTYLTQLSADKNSITLHHLLTHTSGLIPNKQSHQWDIAEFINQVNQLETSSKPGSRRQYCNMCYSLATAILETVSKKSWRDYIKEEVLSRAGMTNARVMEAVHNKDVATGYKDHPLVSKPMVMSDGPDYINEMWWSVAGARGVLADSNDVIQWLESLQANTLISDESRKKMFTAHIEDQGYGWHIDESKGYRRYWKGGGSPMYETQMVLYPEQDIKVVLLLNNNMGWRVPVWHLIESALFSGDEADLPIIEFEEHSLPFVKLVDENGTIELTVLESGTATIRLDNRYKDRSFIMNLLGEATGDSYLGLRPNRGEGGFSSYRLQREDDHFRLILPNGKSFRLLKK